MIKDFNFDDFQKNMSLKKFCTFKIGGNAKYLYIAKTQTQLICCCNFCMLHKIKFKVIGLGANLLFDDNGFDGAIIVNRAKKITKKSNNLIVSSGTHLADAISFAKLHNLSGFESFAGIPSTIGGAINNNAGGIDFALGNLVNSVKVYDFSTQKIFRLTKKDCQFSYRDSIFKHKKFLILSATFNLKFSTFSEIQHAIIESISKKQSTQPIESFSAGSVFKRGEIIPAKEIDLLGLKGTSCGDAIISTKHSGFIINLNNATSKDVETLIELIKTQIKQKFKVNLDLELEIVKNQSILPNR